MGTDKNIKLHIVTDIKLEMKPWWILISLCMASWEVGTMDSNGDVLTLIKQLERRIVRVEKEVQHTKEELKAEIKKAKEELKREIGTHRRKSWMWYVFLFPGNNNERQDANVERYEEEDTNNDL